MTEIDRSEELQKEVREADLSSFGRTGLIENRGYVAEELHRKLMGSRAAKIYREMYDNDALIGAMVLIMKCILRRIPFLPTAPSSERKAIKQTSFLDEVTTDMSQSWPDFISEIMSMSVFGWSWFEILYKLRQGEFDDPDSPGLDPSGNQHSSQFDDGMIGWRKFSPRAQETLERWIFDDEGGVIAMVQRVENRQYTIPIYKSLLFRMDTTKNNPEGRSGLRHAYRSWHFKKRFEEIEGVTAENDATGILHITMPKALMMKDASSSDKSIRTNIQKQAQQFRRGERAVIFTPAVENPDGSKTGFNVTPIKSSGPMLVDVGKTIERYDSRIALAFMGQMVMLGMDNRGGARALGKTMMDFYLNILRSLIVIIEDIVNRFAVQRLFYLNNVRRDLRPKLKAGPVDELGVNDVLLVLEKMNTLGFKVAENESIESWLMSRLPGAFGSGN